METEMKCDCTLGLLSNRTITRSNIAEKLEREVFYQGVHRYQPLTKKQILDSRRGYISKFNYCPDCGVKLNWKQITGEIAETT